MSKHIIQTEAETNLNKKVTTKKLASKSFSQNLSISTKVAQEADLDIQKNLYDYQLHPSLAQMPEMNQHQFNSLLYDMSLNGQEVAIVVQEDTKILLDGRSRLKVCEKLGIKPKVEYFSGSEEEIEFHIISLNDRRRQDSVSIRACKALLFLNQAKLEKLRSKYENQ